MRKKNRKLYTAQIIVQVIELVERLLLNSSCVLYFNYSGRPLFDLCLSLTVSSNQ